MTYLRQSNYNIYELLLIKKENHQNRTGLIFQRGTHRKTFPLIAVSYEEPTDFRNRVSISLQIEQIL